LHHVIFQGHNGAPLVSSADEADELLDRLGHAFRKEDVSVASAAILTTHGHLEPIGRIEPISRAMCRAFSSFGQSHNFRLGRTGAVLDGRFWSRPVQGDGHALMLPPYILLNARKAGLARDVDGLAEYRWCTFARTFFDEPFPIPVDTDALLGRYSEDIEQARQILRKLLDAGEQRWLEDLKRGTVQSVIRIVAARHGIPEDVVCSGSRDRWVAAARAEVVREVRQRGLPVSIKKLARELGVAPRTIQRLG
jgi:hypothetical protein